MKRYWALAFVALAMPLFTGASFAEESSGDARVLNRIFVSAPAPHLGTLHVRPVIASKEDAPVGAVELVFAPVDYADGQVSAASETNKSDRHLIGAVVPTDISNWERSEAGIAGDTQKVYLPNGYYVISQVRYRYEGHDGERSQVYCLSQRSFVFRVGMMETVFMGRLQLQDPRETTDSENFAPLNITDASPEQLRGWRKGQGRVSTFRADPISFTPTPAMCPSEAVHTAGWVQPLP